MNDASLTNCKFTSAIVPYMYGEMSAAESSSFESHLVECGDCTDEFAAISSARYEVYDWKKLEFDELPTPVIRIPYDVAVGASWVEKVRAVFAQGWAVPGVAFAGLAVVSIFAAAFILLRDPGTDIARELDNSNSRSVAMPSPVSSQIAPPVVAKDEEPGDVSEDRPLKVSAPRISERPAARPAVRNVQPKAVEARQATTREEQRKIPRLNDFADDEDTSLRLAELFEDVETRD